MGAGIVMAAADAVFDFDVSEVGNYDWTTVIKKNVAKTTFGNEQLFLVGVHSMNKHVYLGDPL